MGISAWMLAAGLAATATTMASGAVADTRVVPTVLSGTARWSSAANRIDLDAVVQLNDSCWSRPRIQAPLGSVPTPGDVAPIQIVADYATGQMCAQVVTSVRTPPLSWRVTPGRRLRSVRFIGSQRPVVVQIRPR